VEYATIDRITREDLVEFHRKYFHPNNVIMAVWGDFDAGEMKQKIEEAFKDWTPEETVFSEVPEVDTTRSGSVNYIAKEDVNQTTVRMGHIGIRADDPYYYAILVLHEILGGGWGSRLLLEVRAARGLAYSVGSNPGADFHHRGIFFMGCGTKSQSTGAAIEALIHELRRITTEEVTDAELKMAKDNILNSFVFNFDTKGEIVTQQVSYRFYGYPPDFLERYRQGIERVTKSDILAAARARLHPDRLTILAVGRGEDFDRPLSTFGEVRTIDITIPDDITK
jgi:predicted Zn-dependent peptidase